MKYASSYIRKGDLVQVMVGKSKGKTGKVLKVVPKKSAVLVEKLNLIKRHQKATGQHRQSGIVEKEAFIKWSNVMVMCGKCNKPVRIKYKEVDDKKRRVCAKCAEMIDIQ